MRGFLRSPEWLEVETKIEEACNQILKASFIPKYALVKAEVWKRVEIADFCFTLNTAGGEVYVSPTMEPFSGDVKVIGHSGGECPDCKFYTKEVVL